MKIEIVKIVRPLYLRNYAPEYGDMALQVWVNPPRKANEQRQDRMMEAARLIVEMKELLVSVAAGQAPSEGESLAEQTIYAEQGAPESRIKEIAQYVTQIGLEMIDWLAEIWSQGAEETWMSREELRAFIVEADESDPRLYAWLLSETLRMIDEHRSMEKKS